MLQTNGVNGVTNFQAGIQLKSLKKLEREMGLEPPTSSLGSRASFENKEQMRPWRCILTTASHPESSSYPKTAENGVNGVKLWPPASATSKVS